MKVFKSIGGWLEDRTGFGAAIKPILDHKVPFTDWKSGWWYVLGSAVLISFVVQVISGIALSTSYVSSAGEAYNSLKFITDQAVLGSFLRGVHAWGASAMVLFVGAHALHVFIIGAYKFPREVNWLTGAVLLITTLAMAFTGQLLRWDDTAFWSIFVGANMAARTPFLGESLAKFVLAGDSVGGATLSRFFAFHVFFIPGIIFAFIGIHLFLVIRNGISEPPKIGDPVNPKTYRKNYHDLLEREGVPFWPDALWRDAVAAVVIIVAVILLAIVVGPPALGNQPDPANLQVYPRPDWYFLWFFSVLALVPAEAEVPVILLGPLLVGVMIVLLPILANKGERHPLRRPWAMAFVLVLVVMIGTLWITGEVSPWSPKFNAQPLPANLVATTNPQVVIGQRLFGERGCQFCHVVAPDVEGGLRGPNLSNVGNRLSQSQLTTRILNGGNNMPAYSTALKPDELNALVAFLQTRKAATDTSGSNNNR